MTYQEFLETKRISDVESGFAPDKKLIPELLFDFQKDAVRWACQRGRAALFEDCGLGKTFQQLVWANQVVNHTGGKVLILAPLAVAHQTTKEGAKVGIEIKQVQFQFQCEDAGIYITNYQKLARFDLNEFKGVVLDESSILKSFDGSTRTAIIESSLNVPYRLACTATPAPNDFMELGNHAEFLGVMTRTQMLSTFFVHDGGETSKWRLKGHAEDEFWKWICDWALNIRKPSDLGYDDGDFKLPELKSFEHSVDSKQNMDGYLFALPASSLEERRNARRSSIRERVSKACELANSDNNPWLIWCNLNSESKLLTDSIKGAREVTGSDSDEEKEISMNGFTDGSVRVLVTKPTICGYGMNWQHCNNMAFVGLSDSYEQYYQAVRRCWRFGQKSAVNSHIIISKLEGAVMENIKRKESDSTRMSEAMVSHMASISTKQLKGTKQQTITYKAENKIELPNWL